MGAISIFPVAPSKPTHGRRRDIVAEPAYYEQVFCSLIVPFLNKLWTTPTVFTKPPEEHAIDAVIAKGRLPYPLRCYYGPVYPPPPNHVRVRFFTSLEGLKRRDRKADLVAVFPLELSGELDLNRVKQLWGLDSCAAIDPMRWKIFEPTRPDIISAVGVVTLTEYYNAINVIEPYVSESTLRTRNTRQWAKPIFDDLYNWQRSKQLRLVRYLKRKDIHLGSTVVSAYHATQRELRVRQWRLQEWISECDEDLWDMGIAALAGGLIVLLLYMLYSWLCPALQAVGGIVGL